MIISSKDEIQKDAEIKRTRVREYLARNGYDELLISTREHFAWVTSGGDSHVVHNSNMGFGTIVITKDKAWLVAQSMDAARLNEEQANGQGYELVTLRWYDGDVREKARELAGKKIATIHHFTRRLKSAAETGNLLKQVEARRESALERTSGFSREIHFAELVA